MTNTHQGVINPPTVLKVTLKAVQEYEQQSGLIGIGDLLIKRGLIEIVPEVKN